MKTRDKIDQMKKFYSKISEFTFRILTILFCMFGDLLLIHYLYVKFTNYDLFKKMITMVLDRNNIMIGDMPANEINEFFQLMTSSLIFVLIMAFVLHCVIYILHAFKKRFSLQYLRMVSFLGMFCFFIMGISLVSDQFFYGLIFFVQSFLYLFVAIGLIIKVPILRNQKTE